MHDASIKTLKTFGGCSFGCKLDLVFTILIFLWFSFKVASKQNGESCHSVFSRVSIVIFLFLKFSWILQFMI